MGNQRIDQRAGFMASRRMNHQTGRLIQNQQMLVFENDFERNILTLRLWRLRGRHIDADVHQGQTFLRRVLADVVAKPHVAILDQGFQARAGQNLALRLEMFSENFIQTHRGLILRQLKAIKALGIRAQNRRAKRSFGGFGLLLVQFALFIGGGL